MADNILFLDMSVVSSKCLFQVWLFNKDVTDDKIAMIAMCWRIFGALITHDYWPLNGGWPLDGSKCIIEVAAH